MSVEVLKEAHISVKAPILALKNITITMVRPARDLRDLHTIMSTGNLGREARAQREDMDMVVVSWSLSINQKSKVIGSLSLSLFTTNQTTIMSTENLGREAMGRREDMKMAMDITLSPKWSLNWLATLALVTGDRCRSSGGGNWSTTGVEVLDVFGIRRKY